MKTDFCYPFLFYVLPSVFNPNVFIHNPKQLPTVNYQLKCWYVSRNPSYANIPAAVCQRPPSGCSSTVVAVQRSVLIRFVALPTNLKKVPLSRYTCIFRRKTPATFATQPAVHSIVNNLSQSAAGRQQLNEGWFCWTQDSLISGKRVDVNHKNHVCFRLWKEASTRSFTRKLKVVARLFCCIYRPVYQYLSPPPNLASIMIENPNFFDHYLIPCCFSTPHDFCIIINCLCI